jgi:hypothetical protein
MRTLCRLCVLLGLTGLVMVAAGCADDEPDVHSADQLRGALLTVEDVTFIPAESQENMRAVVKAPTPPFDGTLDPYLCSEAGVPMAATLPQAQLELTGSSVMEILLASKDAEGLYNELDAAYQACGAGTSLVYEPLADMPSVGDQSASYRSELGVVTIARFGTDLMVLKWWVGEFFDQAIELYPQLVTTAAERLTALSPALPNADTVS